MHYLQKTLVQILLAIAVLGLVAFFAGFAAYRKKAATPTPTSAASAAVSGAPAP